MPAIDYNNYIDTIQRQKFTQNSLKLYVILEVGQNRGLRPCLWKK